MWEPEVIIGDSRPWPDAMHAVRGRTGERRRYVPERTCSPVEAAKGITWKCSGCGTMLANWVDGFGHCPNCGAKVEGVYE